MSTQEAIETARDAVYLAAADPVHWPAALMSVAKALDAEAAHLVFIDVVAGTASKALWTGYLNVDEMLAHGDRVVADDPWMVDAGAFFAGVRKKRRRLIVQGAKRIDPAEFRRSRFFNEVARPTDVSDYLASATVIDQRHCAIIAANKIGAGALFEDRHRAVAAALAPDLDRAFRLAYRFAEATPQAALRSVWEDSPLPTVLLRDGTVVFCNNAGADALNDGAVARVKASRIAFSDAETQALYETCARGDSRHASRIADTTQGGRWLVQFISVRPGANPFASSSAPSVLMVLTPLSQSAVGRCAAIAGFSELTEGERTLLAAFVRGETVETVAAATGRSVGTVRWHVRNMIAKTGAQSLADLTRIAALLAPS